MAVVYFHRRKDTNEVFYVGIGDKEKRAYKKSNRGHNHYWKNIVNKVGYDVEIVYTDLTWDEACELEIKYIADFGRKDLGLGNLVNMTDGGEGRKRPHTDQTKRKISEGHKGKIVSNKTRKKMAENNKGKKRSLETRIKMNKSNTFKKLTEKDVIYIRKRYAEGGITQKKLGEMFGVGGKCISEIINRKNWKHI